MSTDNTPWQPVPSAQLDWDEHGTPRSREFEDIYYSIEDGRQESEFVFLAGNDLPQRFTTQQGSCFTIGETGFGTGLNFLLTWQAWRETPEPKPALHFVSVEKYPLAAPDLRRALASWPQLRALSEQLLESYPGLLPGSHRLQFEQGKVRLDLHWADCTDTMTDLARVSPENVDAWYLDGFAPARNQSMWNPALCAAIGQLSRCGATFATFTAAGQVRRDLVAAGFEVHKTPGFGRKRERLTGRREALDIPAPSPEDTPWDLGETLQRPPETVLVIGAGLAGCTVANALARRGVKVTVLDKHSIAGAASGNEQGILYTRLSRQHSTLTDFALLSFTSAQRNYRELFARGLLETGRDGELCGNLQLSNKQRDLDYLAPLLQQLPELARVVSRDEAGALADLDLPSGGYWLPGSGWLNPPAVCAALLQHENIAVQADCGALQLGYDDGQWQASNTAGVVTRAPCAILAPGADCLEISELAWLPLQMIRGQTTHLSASDLPGTPRTTLCREGYIAPPREGRYCLGASFVIDPQTLALDAAEHRDNLEKLARAVPAWRDALASLDTTKMEGRVGVRCTSADYLPVAGPVPDVEAFVQRFAPLRKNARQLIPTRGCYLPGLYVSTAHGSRGLTSAPLCAELLASTICAEPAPLSRRLSRALSPARFLIRDLARNRI